jgi:hypothetical protein
MRNSLLTLSFAAALAQPIFPKRSAPPDISGTWVLNARKSKLATGADIRSETVVISMLRTNGCDARRHRR